MWENHNTVIYDWIQNMIFFKCSNFIFHFFNSKLFLEPGCVIYGKNIKQIKEYAKERGFPGEEEVVV